MLDQQDQPVSLARTLLVPPLRSLALVLLAVAAHLLLFDLLYPELGAGMAALAVLPVVVIGWLGGTRTGVIAAILSILLNTLLLNLAGYLPGGWDVVFRSGGGPGSLALVFIGAVVGRLRDLSETSKEQLAERRRATQSLQTSEQQQRALLTAADRQMRERDLLDQVRTLLASELELNALLQTVVEATSQTFGYTHVSLYLREGEELVLQHQHGYEHILQRFSITQGVSGRVVRTGQPAWLPDVRTDPAFLATAEGITSEVCVPLLAREQVIGIFNIESAGAVPLTAADLRIALALSQHIAIALERGRLYASLRESEERYRRIIETAQEGIWIIDAEARTTYANRKMAELLGYSLEELQGMSLFSFMDAEGRAITEAQLARRRQGIAEQLDFRFQRLDGAHVWVILNAVPLLDPSGQYEGALATVTDITERKRVEEALRESEQKFTALYDKIPVAAALSRLPDGILMDVNAAYERTFGYTKQETLGRTSLELGINPDAKARARITAELQAHGSVHNLELSLRSKSGAAGDFLVNIDLVNIAGQKYVLQTAHDISGRKQTERAIQRQNMELAALNQMGQALSRLVEPAELLALIRTVIGQVLDNQDLAIVLYEEATQSLSFPVFTVGGQLTQLPERPIANGLADYVIRTRQPLNLPREVPQAAAALGIEHLGRPVSCFLAVPLLAGDRVLGAIALHDFERENVFDRGHLAVLSTIAAQAAIALENSRLFAETRRRAEQMQVINDIERIMTISLEPYPLADRITHVFRERLNLQNVSIGLIEGDQLVFAAASGDKLADPANLGVRLKVGSEGLTGQVAATGRLLYVPDVQLDPRFKPAQDSQTRSELVVPLKTQAGLLGVLNIESDQLNAFSAELIGIVETLAIQIAISIANARLFVETQQLARTDGLTGLANRRYLFEVGANELSRARRFRHPLSALMLDIDHFKQVNDTYGHAVGDQVLRVVARCCLEQVRESDVVARYGGEEFAIMCLETDLAGGRLTAERLRARIAKLVFVSDQGPLNVTVSVGVASIQAETEGFATLLERADSALYAAKQAGRNRIEVA